MKNRNGTNEQNGKVLQFSEPPLRFFVSGGGFIANLGANDFEVIGRIAALPDVKGEGQTDLKLNGVSE